MPSFNSFSSSFFHAHCFQFLCSAATFPTGPASSLIPRGPGGPATPFSSASHLIPLGPGGPATPFSPFAPSRPSRPGNPLCPFTPFRPGSPVAPCTHKLGFCEINNLKDQTKAKHSLDIARHSTYEGVLKKYIWLSDLK